MVFKCFFYIWTIGVNGFSMVFLISTIGINDFSNGFFYKWTIAIEWMVCGSPLTSMVYQWFWWKWTAVHKEKAKTQKKHDLLEKQG